jgi:hypothetical protein
MTHVEPLTTLRRGRPCAAFCPVYEEYPRSSAEVVAAIYLDLIKPIVKFYPDLDPGREGDGGKQGIGLTLVNMRSGGCNQRGWLTCILGRLRPASSLQPSGSTRGQRPFDRLDGALAAFLQEVKLAA